jgi:thiosulfate/3-mercaptopyruvate sulfurtransferase
MGLALAVMGFEACPVQAQPRAGQASTADHSTIPASARMEPGELAAMIRSGHAPTILQVGFTKLYTEAHIQGAIHAGPLVSAEGRSLLEKTVAHMDRHKLLVIYCGCCPWSKCPNIRSAFEALRKMGFTNVKAVYIPDNFGTDWVQHGYPTVTGE